MNVNKININQLEQTYYIASDIYDVSAHNDGSTFESLSALLSSENLSTLIPSAIRCGGMTIRFINSSDNRYVQYRLMTNDFSTKVSDWEGVDDEPTVGSDNLVKSGGIFQDIHQSTSNIRGLDFSSYTGNVEKYTKGIIFAGFVPVSGYTPSMAEIYALSKNVDDDGLFCFWLWFGDNDHKFRFTKSISSLYNGINCLKSSNEWGHYIL